jgi:hypothetical protein
VTKKSVRLGKAIGPGWVASTVLHGSFLAMGIIVLPKIMPPATPSVPFLPVELVTPGDVSSITAARPDAVEAEPEQIIVEAQTEPEPNPTSEPEPVRKITEAVAAPAPIAPTPQKAAAPAPSQKKAQAKATPQSAAKAPAQKAAPTPPQKTVSAKAQTVTPPAAKKAPTPTPAAAPKASAGLDLDSLSALTNRAVDTPSRRAPQMAGREGAFAKAERSRAAAGMATSLTGALEDSLRSQVAKCWRVPANNARGQDLIVEIRIQLGPDGVIKGTPAMVRPSNLAMVDPALRAAAEGGLRAIRLCQPYELPASRYEDWRDIVWKFDPTQMALQ